MSMIEYNGMSKLNRRYPGLSSEKQLRMKNSPDDRDIQTQKLLSEVNIAAVLTAEIQKLQQELNRSERQCDDLRLELEAEREARKQLEDEHKNCIDMKELLSEMRELVSGLKHQQVNSQQQSKQTFTPLNNTRWPIAKFTPPKTVEVERSAPPSILHEDTEEPQDDLSTLLNISADTFKRLDAFPTSKRYTAELMVEVFGREMLATHSLIGAKRPDGSSKPSLDRMKIKLIIDHVANKFQIPPSSVREAIRSKLNNEDKCFKKRLQEMRCCYTKMVE